MGRRSHSVEPVFSTTFDRMGGEAMSAKAERPLKDAIEARSLAAPKKSNAGAMDPKARSRTTRTGRKTSHRTAKMAKFPSGMDRRVPSEFPSKFPSGMDRTTSGMGRRFPEVEFPSEFPTASTADKAAIYRVTTQVESPTSGKTAIYRVTIHHSVFNSGPSVEAHL